MRISINSESFPKHNPISYGLLVKALDDVQKESLDRFDIPQTPVIFLGSEEADDVTKAFVLAITNIAEKFVRYYR